MPESNPSWETQEVIRWIINDEEAYMDTLNITPDEVRAYVIQGHAPKGLYRSFQKDPPSSWDDVDWEEVALCCG